MGLESATYIEGLVASNPEGDDPKSQGDDHIRLIKSALQASFPDTTGPWNTTSKITAGPATESGDLMQLGQATPVVSGNINAAGISLGGAGFTAYKFGTGNYVLVFDEPAPAGQFGHSCTVAPVAFIPIVCNVTMNDDVTVQILTFSLSGVATDCGLSFQRIINQ